MSIQQVFERFVQQSVRENPQGLGINIVVDGASLAGIQRSARISLSVKNIRYADLLWALCHRTGLGYRNDPYAIYVTGGNQIKLHEPKTAEAVAVARQIKLTFVDSKSD